MSGQRPEVEREKSEKSGDETSTLELHNITCDSHLLPAPASVLDNIWRSKMSELSCKFWHELRLDFANIG